MSRSVTAPSPLPLWAVHALMLLTAGLTSTSFTVGKSIASGMDPAALTLVRFLIAALFFLPIIKFQYTLRLPDKAAMLRYSIISLALTGFFWLMFVALQTTTALNTGVIFTLVPGISGMYSAVLLRERLGKYRVIAMISATTGALWVIFHGELSQVLAFNLNSGDAIFFCSCLLVALYTPLVKLLHRGEPMAVMTFWILVTGSGWLLLFSGYKLMSVPWTAISFHTWAGILYLALFCTMISFFLSQFSTLYLGPTRVMAYSYLYPPFILALDWVFNKQFLPLQALPGIALIVLAMFIVQHGANSDKTKTTAAQKAQQRVIQ
ncbi:MAG: EamA/RhaT family transporter [Desulfobulbus sp.]|nr:MAG: EamA/RhaT family transporter [Desulfobulbus sp.]